jgi:hypothetical protein
LAPREASDNHLNILCAVSKYTLEIGYIKYREGSGG